MKPAEYYTQLKENRLKPVYVLAGDELFLINEAVDALAHALKSDPMNTEVFRGDEASASEIVLAVQTMPFLSERRLIFVKEAHRLKAPEADKLAQYARVPSETSCLVLLWPERLKAEDKQRGLVAAAETKGAVVEFRTPYDSELPSWIQEKVKCRSKKISLDAARALVEESGSGLMDLNNEIEKLALFTHGRQEITKDDVEAASGHTRSANLNQLAEALEARQAERALHIVEDLLREGEIPLRLVATMYRVVRRLAAAREMLDKRKSSHQEIRRELRLHQYFDRQFFTNLSRFGAHGLERTLAALLEADHELKTSARPEAMILEEIVLTLCGK